MSESTDEDLMTMYRGGKASCFDDAIAHPYSAMWNVSVVIAR